jgi:hypothetical protein
MITGTIGTLRQPWRWLRSLSGDHSPLEMPWTRTGAASLEAAELHRVALALEWQAAASPGARAHLLARALIWPAASLVRAVRLVRRHGAAVARRHGVGRARQLLGQVVCANLLNVGPDAYYRYQLFLPDNRRRALEYVQHFESSLLGLERLRRHCGFDLDHKVAFHDRCRALGLATVPILATFRGGRLDRWLGPAGGALPPADLVLKPCNLDSGEGVECWRHDRTRGTWRRDGAEVADLLEHARLRSLERTYLLQPWLANPPSLAPLAGGALCTLRVVTCLGSDRRPRLLQAVLNIPSGRQDINNFGSGGLAAAVEPGSGLLGPAFDDDVGAAPLVAHPVTGLPIAGLRLERHQEMVALCLEAHAHFPGFHSIGWDVAPTPDGPLLLEANTIWDVDLAQRASGAPLAAVLRADDVVARWEEDGGAAVRQRRLPIYGRPSP